MPQLQVRAFASAAGELLEVKSSFISHMAVGLPTCRAGVEGQWLTVQEKVVSAVPGKPQA